MTATAFDVISPVDETVVETVSFAGAPEVDARVERAHRELGPDAAAAFTETKNVFISTEE